MAYITGVWEFRGLPMEVNPSVLIPRVDTEVLAETAIRWLHGRKMDARVLDLCSGSGCIGCAIADALPQARVCWRTSAPRPWRSAAGTCGATAWTAAWASCWRTS